MRRHCRYVLAHVSSSIMSYGNALVCVRSHHVYALSPATRVASCDVQAQIRAWDAFGYSCFPAAFLRLSFSPCIPCHPPIRVSMGYLNRRLAAPRKREGRWVVVCTCASPAETDSGSRGASERRWTQMPGLDLAGAAHIQPIAVGNDLMWERKSLSRGKEHDANLLSATTASFKCVA